MLRDNQLVRLAPPLTIQKRVILLGGIVGVVVLLLLLTFRLVQSESAAGGAMICGYKFDDRNGDGLWDGTLEPGLPNWVISLEGTGGFTQTVTDPTGQYCFTGLQDGGYFVHEQIQPGWQQTYPASGSGHQVVIVGQQSLLNIHFGNHRPAGVYGHKFWDQNGNGSHDSGEPGLANWMIQLDGSGLLSTTLTNGYGQYQFTGLPPGVYTVTEQTLPAGWVQTLPVSPTYYTFPYPPFQVISNLDFGNYTPLSGEIAGTKFHDLDGDGVQDGNEPGLAGWTVHLDGSYYSTATVTDNQGHYSVPGLPPDNYTVYEGLQPPVWTPPNMVQWVQTYPPSGTYSIGLDPGELEGGVDFGNWQNGKNDFCMIPWDNHFLNVSYLDTEIYIFNTSSQPQKAYTLTLTGPMTYTVLAPLPVTLNPLQYAAVPVRIYYPSIFTIPYQSTVFQAHVTNQTAPASSFTCSAALWSYSPQWWTTPNVNSGLAGGIPFGYTQGISFTVTNNSGPLLLVGGNTVSYTVMAMSRGMTDTAIVSLNGLPPGTPIGGQLTIPPGGSADIPISVEFTEFNYLAPTDVVFMLDVDGDGEVDTMTSHLVFLLPTKTYLPVSVKN
jgi:hypothetical protein